MDTKKFLSLIFSPKYIWHFILVLIYGYLTSLLLYVAIFNRPIINIIIFNSRPAIFTYLAVSTVFVIAIVWLISFILHTGSNSPDIFFKKSTIFLLVLSILSIIIIKFPFGYSWARDNVGLFNVLTLGLSLAGYLVFFITSLEPIKNRLAKIPSYWIYILIFLAILAYSIFSLISHNLHFGTSAGDLGVNDQILWHYSQFHIPAPGSFHRLSNMLGEHFRPIYFLIAPFYWIYNNVNTFLVLEIIVLCLGALPVFWLVRSWLRNNFYALGFAFGYLFYFGIQYAVAFPGRSDTFGTTFLAFALYFLFKKRWIWYYLFVVLVLACKENFGLYIAFLGIFAYINRKERLHSLITFILGAIWFYLSTKVWMPAILGKPILQMTFDQLGQNFSQVIKTIFINPSYVLHILVTPIDKVSTYIATILPVAAVSFFAPSFLIIAIPMIGERFLATVPSYWLIVFQYGVTITPIIFLSAASGSCFLREKLNNFFSRFSLQKVDFAQFISIYIVIVTIILVPFLRQAPLLHYFKASFYQQEEYIADIKKLIKILPPDASVSAQYNIVPHLTHRYSVYEFPDMKDNPEFLLLDVDLIRRGAVWPMTKEGYKDKLRDLVTRDEYGVKKVEKSAILFQRNIADQDLLSQDIYNFLYSD